MYESTNSFIIDSFNVSRKAAITINTTLVGVLILPACFAGSFLADFKPFGMDIISFEDFIASNVLLVGGAFIFSLFCFSRYGWGMRKFIRSVNSGEGIKLSRFTLGYIKYAIPMFILVVFILGLIV
jgi:NSS family neurotransmitter:Na+ symporter